jgi:transposase
VREELARDPEGGDLYLFRNRRGDMVKILFFDHGDFCLVAKRLAKGTFRLRLAVAADAVPGEISQAEPSTLLRNAELVQQAAAKP